MSLTQQQRRSREHYERNRETVIRRNVDRKRRKRNAVAMLRNAHAAVQRALDVKTCARCHATKSRAEFPRDKNRADGLYPYCRDCQNSVQRAWTADNAEAVRAKNAADRKVKQDYVVAEKAKPCADCGGCFPPRAMQFHHRDPAEKVAGIAELLSKNRSLDAIKVEIAKCELLCANCHAIRHEEET